MEFRYAKMKLFKGAMYSRFRNRNRFHLKRQPVPVLQNEEAWGTADGGASADLSTVGPALSQSSSSSQGISTSVMNATIASGRPS